MLRSGAVRAKLSISRPDDPEEREADQVAERIMRMDDKHHPFGSPCPCQLSGGELCEECKQEQAKIYRQAATHGTPQRPSGILGNVLRSAGQPIEPKTQAFSNIDSGPISAE